MESTIITNWKPFQPHPEADRIAEGLKNIPDDWALTPVRAKKPYRENWQTESPLSKDEITNVITNGEQAWSKRSERYYQGYASGYGLRLGDASGGLIALDVDGAPVQELLDSISGGDIPSTVTWTSGKQGRYQLLFKIPDQYRDQLKTFQRHSYTTWNNCKCQEGEQLELRYNHHQSVLPPSYHPDTGQYEWLVSPQDSVIADAPDWLIRLATEANAPYELDSTKSSPNNYLSWEKYKENFEYRSHESIPLINCLSKKHRELVESGVGEGNRDNTAIAIAMDAVGCENWLNQKGQAYNGSAEEIIRDFCSRCSPPLGEKDINRIYKSAQKRSTGSAIENNLGEDALKGLIASHFWQWEKPKFPPPSTGDNLEEEEEEDPVKLNDKKLLSYIRKHINLRYNELTREMEVDGEELDCEPYLYLLDDHNLLCTKEKALDMMMKVAKKNKYHPVKEYLKQVHSKTSPIDISNLATRYLGTESPLYDLFVKKMLIGAVARIFNPGCKCDTALILQGEQGIGKSSFFDTLGGEYFDDSMGGGNDKDDLLTLHRSWIQEWGELDRVFGQKQVGEIKHFLSKRSDSFREPYARKTENYLRRSIIVGSVNDSQFLNDPTGARRFWVVPVGTNEIDINQLKQERDGIWAAAVAAYQAGEKWWLTKQEEKESAENNQAFRNQDEWEIEIQEFVNDREEVTVNEILSECFGYQSKEMGRREQLRAANCLKALGWQRGKQKSYKGKRQVVWKKVSPQSVVGIVGEGQTQAQTESEGIAASNDQGVASVVGIAGYDNVANETSTTLTTPPEKCSNGYSTSETQIERESQQPTIPTTPSEQTFSKKLKSGDRVSTIYGEGEILQISDKGHPQIKFDSGETAYYADLKSIKVISPEQANSKNEVPVKEGDIITMKALMGDRTYRGIVTKVEEGNKYRSIKYKEEGRENGKECITHTESPSLIAVSDRWGNVKWQKE